MNVRWSGQSAVITGAASGLGWALAQLAAAQGMRLVLADHNAAGLRECAASLQAAGAEVMALATDVADAQQVQALAQSALQTFGPPNLVFNNAGVMSAGLVWESEPAEWQRVLGVNVMGVVHGVRAFTPLMLQAARSDTAYQGWLVNTASMAGLLCPPNMGVYNVSKHAVVALSETLYHDLSLVSDRVHAAVLCPYFVPTAICEPAAGSEPAQTPSQHLGYEMAREAVRSGKVSAEAVARIVFDALAEGRFYIYSHPHALGGVAHRMAGQLETGVPPDPLAAKPHLRERMRQAILGDSN